MAKMSNVNDMVLQTPVKNFTSTAARITIYSDKSVPERVQIKQEPKSGKNHLPLVSIYKIPSCLKANLF